MERAYYLSQYADEVLPCDPTLDGWAAWLSQPDPAWGRDMAAVEGDHFDASVMRFAPDIIATKTADGWVLSRAPTDVDFLAVRFGPGLGWSPEDIVWGEDMAQALRDHLAECGGDEEYIAVGIKEPTVLLTFPPGPPPRLDIAGTVQ